MNIELLANQGQKAIFTNLAERRYASLQNMKDKNMAACFTTENPNRHRMKSIAKVQDVEFIDDAGSQSVNATWYSLESMTSNVVWIAQSTQNEDNYIELIPMVFSKVKAIVCIGNTSNNISQTFAGLVDQIVWADDIEQAVTKAFSLAEPKETVLFSPSSRCEKSIEENGNLFYHAVNEL